MTTALANPLSLTEIEKLREESIQAMTDSFNLKLEAYEKCNRAVRVVEGVNIQVNTHYHSNKDYRRKKEVIDDHIKEIDQNIWRAVFRALNMGKIMDAQAKKEFRETLEENPLPATEENLRATVAHLQEDSFLIFQRGLVNAFSQLDRRFKSHDGFKLGSRIIFNGIFNGYRSYMRDKLDDVERVFYMLDAMQAQREAPEGELIEVKLPDYSNSVYRLMETAKEWDAIETPYFRGRRFLNGNLHCWFTRPDLVRKANLLLADYYGEQVGESSEVCDPSDISEDFLPTIFKELAYYPTPNDVIYRMMQKVGYWNETDLVLEPNGGEGAILDYMRNKELMIKSHCEDRIPKPPNAKVYEIDPTRAATLRGKGYDVSVKDFLTVTPTAIYDRIFMNPPFTRGRDVDHVTHALKFLKPGGVLVAVMSAATELSHDKRRVAFRKMTAKNYKPITIHRNRGMFEDLPALSFQSAGTNVNTVLFSCRAPS